jgi:hypothetical protein
MAEATMSGCFGVEVSEPPFILAVELLREQVRNLTRQDQFVITQVALGRAESAC